MTKLLKDFKDIIKNISKSKPEIQEDKEENYFKGSRIYTGNSDTDNNSRFLINGKPVQGIPSKNSEMLNAIKRAFYKKYK